MRIGVPKECYPGECRVATTPALIKTLHALGYSLLVEQDAGSAAHFSDDDYRTAGAEISTDPKTLWDTSDIIIKVRPPQDHPQLRQHEADLMHHGQTLISFIWPAQNKALLERLAKNNVNVLAMDSVPRISRAQKLDALSSMANIAGYRAIIEAANHFGRFFTGQITAAGKVAPAQVLVIGAGVAGLAAIGTASSLGAIVRAFDTRPEVKEQVESMGAEFLMLDFKEDGSGEGGYAKVMSKEFIEAEMALFAEQAKTVDIIVTTALIPGKPAPELITEAMVKTMRPGSVIVDLAAEQGGNCKLTERDQTTVKHGVKLIGYTDLPSRLPTQSSQLYGTNIRHLLTEITPNKDGAITIDMEDEVVGAVTVIKQGKISWTKPRPLPPPRPPATPPAPATTATTTTTAKKKARSTITQSLLILLVGGLGLFGLGAVAPPSFLQHFIVFILACFVGYMVIWNVTPSLHTPLMSVTNAVSSIIIIGALIQISAESIWLIALASFCILITSINISGGFAVTQRMLQMFRK